MSSVKFYTLYSMRNATIESSQNINSSYPATNVLDYNRNTLCKGSSTSQIIIAIDLGAAHSITGLIIDVRNYDLHNVSGIDRYYSSNGTSYTFFSGGPSIPTTRPILVQDIGTARNYRYFKLIFNTATSVNVNLGMVGWCYIHELSNRHQVPSTEGRRALVTTTRGRGSQTFTNVVSRNGVSFFTHKYFLSTAAELNTLKTVFKQSAEIGLPFVMVDGDNDPMILRWDRDIVWRDIDHECYEATCSFREVPYIESGELY